MLTSTEVYELVPDCQHVDLHRWNDRGWLRRHHRAGRGAPLRGGDHWPDWTPRMVRLLLVERQLIGGGATEYAAVRSAVFRAVADALEIAPEVPWVVIDPRAERAIPCLTAEQVVALVLRAGTCATVVAIPA